MKRELKPCYRCGGTYIALARVFDIFPEKPLNRFSVNCYSIGCTASTKFFKTATEAAKAWNRLAENPELYEELIGEAPVL